MIIFVGVDILDEVVVLFHLQVNFLPSPSLVCNVSVNLKAMLSTGDTNISLRYKENSYFTFYLLQGFSQVV